MKAKKKNSKTLLIITVVFICAIGTYFLLVKRSNKSQNDSDKFVGTLKEAAALGVGMKCTYSAEGNEYEGYIKGEKYKGKMKVAGGQSADVIVKDNCVWSWSETHMQGVKTCFDKADENTEKEMSIWDQPQVGSGSGISYNCTPYQVNDSQFEIPSDIEFTDLDSMMEDYDQ